MATEKRMCSFSHVLLHAVGLALICGGTLLIHLQEELKYTVFIACAVAFGLSAALVLTLFWTNYRMKRQLYKTVRQQYIYAIARPDSFPPSYEASQSHRGPAAEESVGTADSVEVLLSPPPPLYSQESSAAPGCWWSRELPPPYRQRDAL